MPKHIYGTVHIMWLKEKGVTDEQARDQAATLSVDRIWRHCYILHLTDYILVQNTLNRPEASVLTLKNPIFQQPIERCPYSIIVCTPNFKKHKLTNTKNPLSTSSPPQRPKRTEIIYIQKQPQN